MAFTEQEKQVISWGAANGKSKEQVKQAIVNLRAGVKPQAQQPTQPQEPGYIERVANDYKKAGQDIVDATTRPIATMQNFNEQNAANPPSTTETLKQGGTLAVQGGESMLRSAGSFMSSVFAPLTEAVAPAMKPVMEQVMKIPGVSSFVEKIMGWAKENPELAKDAQAVVDIATSLAGAKGAAPVEGAIREGAAATGDALKAGVEATKGAVETGGKLASGAVTLAKDAAQSVSKMPERIATNVANKEAAAAAIEQLPSQAAKRAVQEGIDMADAKSLLSISKEQKPVLKNIADSVKAFASGQSKTNPIEAVGQPIVERVNMLRKSQNEIGSKLAAASEKLGVVSEAELKTSILDKLRKVPGMSGLTEKDGVLHFKNTVLTTSETQPDRDAIQSIYTQASTWGNGAAKHRMRQELFEILGGKKKAGIQLTATQDKAYQAIRSGLLDVLESKNPEYKVLSQQYAQVTKPLEEIGKRTKGLFGANEDVANMSAGLLARRLTSAATSNPEIRNLLKLLDEATPQAGNSLMSAQTAQDVYNIMNRYYDIAPKTSFQGLSQTAVEKGNMRQAVTKAVTDVIGRSDATRQKALEDLINEILSSP